MVEATRGERKWLLRLYNAYIVCAALLFGVTWFLFMVGRDVPTSVFGIAFGAAFVAAVVSHFVNGRDNWPDSFE